MYSNEQYEAIYRQTWEEKPRGLESLGSRQIDCGKDSSVPGKCWSVRFIRCGIPDRRRVG